MTTDSVYVVSQRFHHAGMDDERQETYGVFSDVNVAMALTTIMTERWANIAYDAEMDELQLDTPLDDNDTDDLIEWLAENDEPTDEQFVEALDLMIPNWRGRRSGLIGEWEHPKTG